LKLEILCAGIGGRGVLLASTILIETAIAAGLKASASDEYGMSQRGGSVVSLVKVGDFKSPLIGRENADVLISFEESEFYRNLMFLKKGGMAIVNTHKEALPDAVISLLRERETRYGLLDADGIAKKKGMIQSANMAVLGFFSHFSAGPYTYGNIENMIRTRVPKRFLEKNLEVFREGHEAAKSS
jgi:indolepyruvate ferredoxin oxidoreductase beta subunit